MHRSPRVTAAAAALLLQLAIPGVAAAHEIPARVTAQVIVKADDDVVRVLVRVPLEAMRDNEFPLRGPGYLDLERASSALRDAARLWLIDYITVFADGRPLPAGTLESARVALPSDRSFDSWRGALASAAAPPVTGVDLPWQQALLDVAIAYPVAAGGMRYSVDAALAHLGVRTTVVMRFVAPDGTERTIVHDGRAGAVHMNPRWHQTAAHFVGLGIRHIPGGLDHMLFLLCLVIPIRRFRPLLGVITAFTIGHSVTLMAAAAGAAPTALWFPPLVETLIAATIVWLALENIIGARVERRWRFAFGFGLVHGFGFAFALRESLQLAGVHVITALAAFNVGVELGQIAVLAVAVPGLTLLFRRVPERAGGIVLSALVAHSAWHWMIGRGSELRAYDLMPALDAALALSLMRAAMLVIAAILIVQGVAALDARYGARRLIRARGALSLFLAQRGHWLDAGGAPRRHGGRAEPDDRERGRGQRERETIGR